MSLRDIVVNALLGTFLLLVFFACLAAIALVAWFGLIGLDWVVRLVVPGRTLPTEFLIFGTWALLSLWSGVGHARKGRWRNAFLCFICAPLVVLAWFSFFQSPIGGAGQVLSFWIPLMLLTVADASLGRLRFFLTAAIAGTAAAVDCGLLGSGTLSRTVANCLLAMVAVWWIAMIRNNWRTEAPDQPLALPPAGA
jgi:hypothetical protein